MIRALPLLVLLLLASPTRAGDGCEPYPITEHSPTGQVGCEVYGIGTASMWGGPGVARNDCRWPWTDCQTIAIRSLQTGIVIIVTPSMYGDLWLGLEAGETGPNGERPRIVDLDPAAVAALGVDPSLGLWEVEVWAVREGASSAVLPLPDTAAEVGE